MGFSVNKHNEIGQVYISPSKLKKYGLDSSNKKIRPSDTKPLLSKMKKYGLDVTSLQKNVDGDHKEGNFFKMNAKEFTFFAANTFIIITSIAIIAIKLKFQPEING